MSDVLMTVAEAAGYLRCHPQTVRGYIRDERLPAVQLQQDAAEAAYQGQYGQMSDAELVRGDAEAQP